MALHIIPLVPSVADYTFTTTLNSVHYGFRVFWNDRDLAWYFDIYDGAGVLIQAGIKIVLGTFLGGSLVASPFTEGVFLAMDTSGQMKDAGFDDLGTRVQFVWVPTAEVVAAFDLIFTTL